MWIEKIDENTKTIDVAIPLTRTTGKTRVKHRKDYNEYGIPVATKSTPFSEFCYVEWQIGYDVVVADNEKLNLTTIKDKKFIGANNKEKTLYELSEYIYYFYLWGIISKEKLSSIKNYLANFKEKDYIETNEKFQIKRGEINKETHKEIDFATTQVKYPLLIHKFSADDNMLAEIKMTEKQYAVGVQPMLYLCFPISALASKNKLIGRCAKTNETATLTINSGNINTFLEMLKIFGILSKNHNHDVIEIINRILE